MGIKAVNVQHCLIPIILFGKTKLKVISRGIRLIITNLEISIGNI